MLLLIVVVVVAGAAAAARIRPIKTVKDITAWSSWNISGVFQTLSLLLVHIFKILWLILSPCSHQFP
jgi:hypothetical protein